jgi:hypothetical protein
MSPNLHPPFVLLGVAVSAAITVAELASASANPTAAETTLTAPTSPTARHQWAIETELIQPFVPTVGIIHVRAARSVWGTPGGARADVIAGVYIRPHIEHDIVETIDEYMATLGARYFAWRGLHAEALLNAGVAWGTNKLDGMDYRTPTLFAEVNVGYQLSFFTPGGLAGKPRDVGLYVAPQVGFLTTLGVGNDIGPRDGKPDYFFTAALLVGVSF